MSHVTALLALIVSTAIAPHPHHFEKLATTYFETFNKHDVPALRAMWADNGSLRDWEVEKTGADQIANFLSAGFAAFPQIRIDVMRMHVSNQTHTAVCEILVYLNNAKNDVLKVVDVISFDRAGKVSALRAYKG